MNDPLVTHIGAKIRAKRLELGFGQNDFASLAGIEPARLSQAEKGIERLLPTQIAAVCKLLGTQVAWLYEDAPEAGAKQQLRAFPHADYAVTGPDRQQLMDNFDRLPRAEQEQLVNLSSMLMASMVGKAKTGP
jgi:transcriptional regulator with XRE-family HTH domain